MKFGKLYQIMKIMKLLILKEAAELSNLSKSTISGYCNNLHKDPNGYIWKYETKK